MKRKCSRANKTVIEDIMKLLEWSPHSAGKPFTGTRADGLNVVFFQGDLHFHKIMYQKVSELSTKLKEVKGYKILTSDLSLTHLFQQ